MRRRVEEVRYFPARREELERAEVADGGFHVRNAEEGGACDDGVGAGGEDVGEGAVVDAAVDFDVVGEPVGFAPCFSGADLVEGFGDEGLAAEACVDGHDEEEVDLVEPWFSGGEGGLAVDGEAAGEAGGADAAEGIADVVIGFDVDGDVVCSGLDEAVEEVVRAIDHEVDVEEDVVGFVDGGDELGAEADIVDEVAVHDIEVEPVDACADGAGAFFCETAPVGGEEGRGDDALGAGEHGGGFWVGVAADSTGGSLFGRGDGGEKRLKIRVSEKSF